MEKTIRTIGILLLTTLVGVAAGLYFDLPTRWSKPHPIVSAAPAHTCSMHAHGVKGESPDHPQSNMASVAANEAESDHSECGGKQHTCCPDQGTTTMKLPPGHPPIPGMTVATNTPNRSITSAR